MYAYIHRPILTYDVSIYDKLGFVILMQGYLEFDTRYRTPAIEYLPFDIRHLSALRINFLVLIFSRRLPTVARYWSRAFNHTVLATHQLHRSGYCLWS
jgi:hypothetical protein